MALIHFLLIFDLHRQELVGREEFTDGARAAQRYAELEREYRGEAVEIILVGSDSLETVMQTHAQYFGRRGDLALPAVPA